MQIRRRLPHPVIPVEELRFQVKVPGEEPRSILEEIVWHKEAEVERRRELVPLTELQKQVSQLPPTQDFVAALRQGKTSPAVIAEVKKASPSKGVIRANFDPVAIAQSYQQGGATCLSVLTDEKYFQGSFENLSKIRAITDLPLLCKDFVLYPYQMYLARASGADAVLLIAAILSDSDLKYFLKIARVLGLAALVEVHTLEELDRVLAIDIVNLVGINNRNLQTFAVDLQTTCSLLAARREQIQAREIVVVSESGLHTAADLHAVVNVGANAVLIGESFMRQANPGHALAELFSQSSHSHP